MPRRGLILGCNYFPAKFWSGVAGKKREKCRRIDHDGWLDLFVLDVLAKLEGAVQWPQL